MNHITWSFRYVLNKLLDMLITTFQEIAVIDRDYNLNMAIVLFIPFLIPHQALILKTFEKYLDGQMLEGLLVKCLGLLFM